MFQSIFFVFGNQKPAFWTNNDHISLEMIAKITKSKNVASNVWLFIQVATVQQFFIHVIFYKKISPFNNTYFDSLLQVESFPWYAQWGRRRRPGGLSEEEAWLLGNCWAPNRSQELRSPKGQAFLWHCQVRWLNTCAASALLNASGCASASWLQR